MGFFEQTTVDSRDNSLWVERYRPSVLDDYIGNEHLKEKVSNYIENGDVPHLLFHGRPGTGKTSISKLIVNSIECDYLMINASDERGIDTIRTRIKNFASSMGFKPYKIIILDEADALTPDAQPALRNVMEVFSGHCRFILTCNYIEKIIEPLQSRCQLFHIIPPSKKEIAIHVSKILQREQIKFEPKDLVPIIDSSYPDIRRVINTCQLNSINGTLKVDTKDIMENDYKQKVIDILVSNSDKRAKYTEIRKVLSASRVTDFTDLYTLLYERIDSVAEGNTSFAILKIAEYQYKASLSIDKEIPTMALIVELLNIIK